MPIQQKQTQERAQSKHFWSFRNAADGNTPPELILYGDISSSTWWGDEVTPRQFSEELSALGTAPEIIVRINSGGGDVFAANAIYTRLKDCPAKITVKIDGWAASAATIIAMAGDVIEIPGNGLFMVHKAKMGLCGYYGDDDLAKMQGAINVINNSIVNGYALKTGLTPEAITAIMAAETWYDGKQAVDAGFCDNIMFEEIEAAVENSSMVVVNSVPLDLARFQNLPVSLLNRCANSTPSGFSNTQTTDTTKKERKEMANSTQEIKTVDDLKAAYPDLVGKIVQAATDAERTRIQDIENVALAGYEKIVDDAKFTNPIAAGDVAKKIVAEQKKQGADYLNSRESDVENSGVTGIQNAAKESPSDKGGANEFDAAIDKLYPKTK